MYAIVNSKESGNEWVGPFGKFRNGRVCCTKCDGNRRNHPPEEVGTGALWAPLLKGKEGNGATSTIGGISAEVNFQFNFQIVLLPHFQIV